MKAIDITFANPGDEELIKGLLSACGLPDVDVTRHLQHFITAKDGNHLIGVAGLEPIGKLGLVRSLAVARSHRGTGLGKLLYEKIDAYAHLLEIQRLYILTTTADGFFKKLGFEIVNRQDIPPEIRQTTEFTWLCPSNATCMVRKISNDVQ